jgi:hypothetical protein
MLGFIINKTRPHFSPGFVERRCRRPWIQGVRRLLILGQAPSIVARFHMVVRLSCKEFTGDRIKSQDGCSAAGSCQYGRLRSFLWSRQSRTQIRQSIAFRNRPIVLLCLKADYYCNRVKICAECVLLVTRDTQNIMHSKHGGKIR